MSSELVQDIKQNIESLQTELNTIEDYLNSANEKLRQLIVTLANYSDYQD